MSDPGIKDTDVLLFVFRTNENEEATDTITYTEHKVDDVCILLYMICILLLLILLLYSALGL